MSARQYSLACVLALLAIDAVASGRIDGLPITEGLAGVDADSEFIKIRGRVDNPTDRWLKAVRIHVDLKDPSGKPIEVTGFLAETQRELGRKPRDGVMAERLFVPPRGYTVFEYTRDPAKLGGVAYGSHTLSASAEQVEGDAPDMVVEDFTYAGRDGFFTVEGRIHNRGTVRCRSARAVLAFYDANEVLLRVWSKQPDEAFQQFLEPGASVSFDAKAISVPSGHTATRVEAFGDCDEEY